MSINEELYKFLKKEFDSLTKELNELREEIRRLGSRIQLEFHLVGKRLMKYIVILTYK